MPGLTAASVWMKDSMDCRKALLLDLDEGDVCGRVGSDDPGVISLVVVEGDLDLRSVRNHMVVGHYVSVRTDDDSGAASLLLPLLGLLPHSEEEPPERIDLVLLGDRHGHIDNGLDSGFSRESEVRIIVLCQIDSLGDIIRRLSVHGGDLLDSAYRGGLKDAIGCQHAEQH